MSFTFIKTIIKTLHETVQEDGQGSYSRMSGAVIITATLGWITYLVIKTHALPDLTAPSVFIASGSSAYAVNQAKQVAAAMKGNANGPQTEDPAPKG